MGQIIGLSVGGNTAIGVAIVVAVVGVAVALRILSLKRGNLGKCPKCGAVFEVSRLTFATFHFGPFRHMQCPACSKWCLMRTGVKDAVTWPKTEKTEQKQETPLSAEEELNRRIRDSKYETV